MRTLARTALRSDGVPDPLPTVFKEFERFDIIPSKGTITMVAAMPGSMKSFLMLKLLHRWALPSLYFSADTAPVDQLVRAAAMVTGHTQREVREGLMEGGEEFYSESLSGEFDHVRWVFETDPTYEDVVEEVAAYTEVMGEYPQVIVVDNLANVMGEAEGEYQSQKETVKVLKRLVRITGAALFVVHHMNETKSDRTYPSPVKDLANKLDQFPEMVMSIAFDPVQEMLRVAAVKNRNGKSDASGSTYCQVWVDPERAQFYESDYNRQAGIAV